MTKLLCLANKFVKKDQEQSDLFVEQYKILYFKLLWVLFVDPLPASNSLTLSGDGLL